MYCRSCGNPTDAGVKYCPKCGASVEGAFAPEAPAGDFNAFAPASPAVNADAGNPDVIMKKARLKRTAVALAAAALVLTVIASVFGAVADAKAGYLEGSDYRILALMLGYGISVVIAGLFVLFCGLMGRRTPALTAIPAIISVAVDVLMIFVNRWLAVYLFFYFPLIIAFTLFYTLSVARVFKSGTTAKVLTVVFGVLARLTASVYTVIIMIRNFYWYGRSSGIAWLAAAESAAALIAGILSLIAMIVCVSYVYAGIPRISYNSYGYSAPQAAPYIPVLMFCPKCGMRFPAGKRFCDQCGAELSQLARQEAQYQYYGQPYRAADPQDAPSGGFAALGFFFPVVGLILYLTWKDRLPLRSKSAGKGALAGVITSVSLSILTWVVYFIWLSNILH